MLRSAQWRQWGYSILSLKVPRWLNLKLISIKPKLSESFRNFFSPNFRTLNTYRTPWSGLKEFGPKRLVFNFSNPVFEPALISTQYRSGSCYLFECRSRSRFCHHNINLTFLLSLYSSWNFLSYYLVKFFKLLNIGAHVGTGSESVSKSFNFCQYHGASGSGFGYTYGI